MYLNVWKHFRRQFLLTLFVFLFLSSVCVFVFEAILKWLDCIVKSLTTTLTYYFFVETQVKKENLKIGFWVSEFKCASCYISLPNVLNVSLVFVLPSSSRALTTIFQLSFLKIKRAVSLLLLVRLLRVLFFYFFRVFYVEGNCACLYSHQSHIFNYFTWFWEMMTSQALKAQL